MPQSDPPAVHVFDVSRIRELVELMEGHDLSVMELQAGRQRIRLRRGYPPAMTTYAGSAPAAMPPQGYAPAPMMAPPATSGPAASSAPAAPDTSHLKTIGSPMVGTFFRKANPKSEVFVQIGSRVAPDTIVCLIEAMKTFTDIPAGVSGVITEILANDGDAVEFERPLFRVDPTK